MARKKIIFAIVEGPSDATALALLLEKVFANEQLYVHVVHGDITTQRGVSAQNILNRVGNCVREYASSSHFRSADFSRIIHIIDSDGAYIDDGDIVEDSNTSKLVYSTESITGPDRQAIIARNSLKRSVLARLIACGTIWNIPYNAYYMSCNLDHVLYNKQNSSDEEKRADALEFVGHNRNDICGFLGFMKNSDFSIDGDYTQSWDYIKQEHHSLERHSNFGLCLPEPNDAPLFT